MEILFKDEFEKAAYFILRVLCISKKQASEEANISRQQLTNVLNKKTNCGLGVAEKLQKWSKSIHEDPESKYRHLIYGEWKGYQIILPTKNGAPAPNEAEG